MILDHLDQAERYYSAHRNFMRAFQFLRTTSLTELPVGRNEIEGENLFVIVGREPGRGRHGAKLEAHRRYIDIQLTLEGAEEIGWRPLGECARLTSPYDEERDIMFFADQPQSWIMLPKSHFMIFFPSDAHAPLAGGGLLHKAVVKVAV
jgi:biofilm protein TabA